MTVICQQPEGGKFAADRRLPIANIRSICWQTCRGTCICQQQIYWIFAIYSQLSAENLLKICYYSHLPIANLPNICYLQSSVSSIFTEYLLFTVICQQQIYWIIAFTVICQQQIYRIFLQLSVSSICHSIFLLLHLLSFHRHTLPKNRLNGQTDETRWKFSIKL